MNETPFTITDAQKKILEEKNGVIPAEEKEELYNQQAVEIINESAFNLNHLIGAIRREKGSVHYRLKLNDRNGHSVGEVLVDCADHDDHKKKIVGAVNEATLTGIVDSIEAIGDLTPDSGGHVYTLSQKMRLPAGWKSSYKV